MMNDDNLESNLLTSSLLKMCPLLQVELCVYCPVAGDELNIECVMRFDTLSLFIQREDNLLATTVYMEVQWNVP